MEKGQPLPINSVGRSEKPHAKPDYCLMPYIKIKSTQTKDFSLKPETIKY